MNNKYFIFTLVLLAFSLLTYAQDSFIAKSGDGIYSKLRAHNIPFSRYNEFIEINKKALIKGDQLVIGRKYYLPTTSPKPKVQTQSKSSEVKVFPIFGKEHESVEIKSNKLKGAVYYLVSGHGGPDPGAVGKYNGRTVTEDEYAYDVTLRLARELLSHGAFVYMITRDTDGIRNGQYLPLDEDERCYKNQKIPLNQKSRLQQRKDAVNKLYIKNKGKYQRLLVIHIDARSKGQNIDVFFYHDERSKYGKKLCLNLQDTFEDKYKQHQPGRGYKGTVSARSLYMLKNTYPVTSYIELGNINHHRDQQRFVKNTNRQALANWLCDGLMIDYNQNK